MLFEDEPPRVGTHVQLNMSIIVVTIKLKNLLDAIHHSLNPDSAFAKSLIPFAYAFARSPGARNLLIPPYIIAAGHGLAVGTPWIILYSCKDEIDPPDT